jgi:hypothetical protein
LVRDVTARLIDQFLGERSDVKRLARRRRQSPSRLIATLAAAFFLIFPGDGHRNWAVGSALAQGEAKTKMQRKLDYREFIDSCAGRRIEFRFGATSLHIDPRWLDGTVELMNRFPYGCPTVPVADISPVAFNKALLESANIPGGMGRHYLFFQIARATTPSDSSRPPATKRPAELKEPVVIEVSRVAQAPESTRVYELHYPDGDDGSATTVQISCGGEAGRPAGRRCSTVYQYRYRRDLIINYLFQQDQLPIPRSDQASSPEGLTEPQGILILDTRIRAWIDSLRAKP